VASQVVNVALTSMPAVLGYYSVFGEFPDADAGTISEVREIVNDVEKKIVSKFSHHGIKVDEKSAFDLATKLVILSFLHPMDTANAILNYSIENIVPETYSILLSQKKDNEYNNKMPGSWSGGKRLRRMIALL